jgi:hypothetical protein
VPARVGNSSDICQATNRHPGQKEVPFTLPVAVYSMQQRTFGAIDDGALEAGVMVIRG